MGSAAAEEALDQRTRLAPVRAPKATQGPSELHLGVVSPMAPAPHQTPKSTTDAKLPTPVMPRSQSHRPDYLRTFSPLAQFYPFRPSAPRFSVNDKSHSRMIEANP